AGLGEVVALSVERGLRAVDRRRQGDRRLLGLAAVGRIGQAVEDQRAGEEHRSGQRRLGGVLRNGEVRAHVAGGDVVDAAVGESLPVLGLLGILGGGAASDRQQGRCCESAYVHGWLASGRGQERPLERSPL